MATFLLAQRTSDNAPAGALLSLWLPLGLFIVVATVLWVIYARPHNRVPPRPIAHGASSVAGARGATSVAGSPQGPSAGPQAGAESAADDSGAQPPAGEQPGTDDTGPEQ